MQPPGGGNGVAAWMLQALSADHDVTVLSWWPVDVAPINRFFGTTLRSGDFATHVVPRFVAPHPRFASGAGGVAAFEPVDALHAAGDR